MKLLNKKNIIVTSVIVIILSVILSMIPYAVSLIPYSPSEPKKTAEGDFSYVSEYTSNEIDKMMKKHNLPSIAVSLLNGDDVFYQQIKGLSNIEEGILADNETVYKVGSIAKLFTAVETMRLYDEGLIDLDAPITTYIPDFSIKSCFNDSGVITIRNILAHRSGLPRNGNIPLWAWDNGTLILRDLVASLEESYLAFPADYKFKYSNIGFNILARIIELKRGEWFANYMRDSFLRPLGMNSSGFISTDIVSTDKIAVGYFKEKKENIAYQQYDIITLASGNLYSTLDDMNEFAKFIFNKGNVDGVQLLNESTLSMMFESHYPKPTDPQKVGMGFFYDRTRLPNNELAVFHAGINQGTASIIALIPEEQLGVVMFSNSDEFESISKFLAVELLELLYEAKTGLRNEESKIDVADVSSSILESYVGYYVVEGEIAEVSLVMDKLLIINFWGFDLNLIPVDDSSFIVKHWLVDFGDIYVKFYQDSLIVNFGHVHYSNSPRYNRSNEFISEWVPFLGEYKMWLRHFSIYTEEEIPSSIDLKIVDGILKFSWNNFILKPISSSELIIENGPFDGETMFRDSNTGYIYWQTVVFKPAEN